MKPKASHSIPEVVLILFAVNLGTDNVFAKSIDTFASSCGNARSQSTGRVIGGDETKPGEFPWITSIQSKEGQHFCAGFMISSRYLISAAHCFSQKYNVNIKYNDDRSVILDSVVVAISRVQLSDHSDPSKIIGVKRLIRHPAYEEIQLDNDIAILELLSDLELSDNLSPICLPKVQDEDTGMGTVTVAGWGYRQCNSSSVSNELHKITVPLWDGDACKKSYEDENYDFQRKDYVCAGSDGKDIFKGDSGGPAMKRNDKNEWTAVGIVSSGKFMCSDRVPGVYTKLSSYLQWIQSKME